jgi:hypothetical protein
MMTHIAGNSQITIIVAHKESQCLLYTICPSAIPLFVETDQTDQLIRHPVSYRVKHKISMMYKVDKNAAVTLLGPPLN